MRNYVPPDGGKEPTDVDEYYDYPARTAKDLAARFYVIYPRDPQQAAHMLERQNAAIMALLRWSYDNRQQLRAKGHTLPDSWPE